MTIWLNATQARVIRTALRDISDGHVGLWATVQRFDARTGAELPEPIISVGPDRIPNGIDHMFGPRWWEFLIDAGWLVLRDLGDGRHAYEVTEAGRTWLAENGGA